MLYKPSQGKFKDNLVVFHNGRYYLLSMYAKTEHPNEGVDYRNIWLAESDDGVHWRDAGPVVEDFDSVIFAMGIHKVGDTYILNHGSFTGGNQNTLKFWESHDLKYWKYLGKDRDLTTFGLDNSGKTRLDAMNVVNSRSVYYGYATGPRGFLKSEDGYHWNFMDTCFDFKEYPESPSPLDEGRFECGGCKEIDGVFYYLGGWFNFLGRKGYSTCCLRSSSPEGPFVPDPVSYRLSGNSGRWVSLWARFAAFCPENLVNGYMQQGFGYEQGDTWMPPLKKAEVDSYGHMRLKYWPKNDRLLGKDYSLDKTEYTVEAKEYNSLSYDPVDASIDICPVELDAETGFIVSGFIEATNKDLRCTSPSVGIYLEENTNFGAMIWLHGYGWTEIGYGETGGNYTFTVEDFIDYGCAAPAGIIRGKPHSFRLLVHKNMYELYLDNFHIQTFNTAHFPDKPGLNPRRIGFLARNGVCRVTGLKINAMEGI
jgi:hypothetical protein